MMPLWCLPCHRWERASVKIYTTISERDEHPERMGAYRIIDAQESGFATLMPAVYFVKQPDVVS